MRCAPHSGQAVPAAEPSGFHRDVQVHIHHGGHCAGNVLLPDGLMYSCGTVCIPFQEGWINPLWSQAFLAGTVPVRALYTVVIVESVPPPLSNWVFWSILDGRSRNSPLFSLICPRLFLQTQAVQLPLPVGPIFDSLSQTPFENPLFPPTCTV